MGRAALYARISLDKTGEEIGVQRQLHDMRQLAEVRKLDVVAEITENDVSASKGLSRPGYEKLWAMIRSGQLDHVVVFQSSRLMRSRKDRAEVIQQFGQHNVDVIAVKGPSLDLRTAYGRGMADMMTAFDSMEGEVKAERVSASIADLARRGKAWGYCPYGWDRQGRGVHAKQTVNAAEAAVVRELVDRLLAGESLNELYRDMNVREIPAPGHAAWTKLPSEVREQREAKGRKPPTRAWAKSTVRTLVVRPANAAIRVHGGVELPGDWPPLIDPHNHRRVVALLNAPERRSHSGPRPGARKHLLTGGLGECGVCHGPLRVWRRSGKRGNGERIYLCAANTHCTGRKKDAVDDLVERVVLARLAEPDALDWLAPNDDAARRLTDECDELQGRLDAAAVSQAAGRISIRALELISAELQPQLDALRRERDAALVQFDVEVLRELAGPEGAVCWEAMSMPQRRRALTTIGLEAVRLLPRTKHGPGFEPETVEFQWRKSAAATAR